MPLHQTATSVPNHPRPVKIAYGVLVHRHPQQFWWLYHAIYNSEDVFSIHIDQKTPEATYTEFRDIIGTADNLHFLPRRRVNWGGWSQSQANFDAMAMLLQADNEWTHFVNLSGSCYPLTPRDQRIARLSDMPLMNCLDYSPLASASWARHRFRRSFTETPEGPVNTRLKKAPPSGFAIDYRGEFWHVLTRPFCEWIVESSLAHEISRFFVDTAIPEECVVQTLLSNSPFRESVGPYQWEVIWEDDTASHPEVLTMKRSERLVGSDKLFARKFDETADPDILHLLADRIGAPRKPGRST